MPYEYAPEAIEVGNFMRGHCAAWAYEHQRRHPHLTIGIHWEKLSDYQSEKLAAEDGEEWDGKSCWQIQHVFTHDGRFAYDASGKHALPYEDWDETDMQSSMEEVEDYGMLEMGYTGSASDLLDEHDPINSPVLISLPYS